MKRRLAALFFFVILFSGPARAGQEVVAVQSIRVKPYENAIKGFKSVCESGITRLVLSEREGIDVEKYVSGIRPDLVLAIGKEALSRARGISDTPVVYLMVPNPGSVLSGEKNITGVSMNIPEEKQIMALMDSLPNTRRIGLIYDPDRTGPVVERAKDFAGRIGVQIIAREIHNAKDAPTLIMRMKGKIDVFWMLPDLTVVTPETVEFLLLFSFENQVPIFSFSEKYVELGAFMSMDIDAFDLGVQAGELANRILDGNDIQRIQQTYARKAIVSTNLMVAGKLGIHLNVARNLKAPVNERIKRNPWILD